MENNRLSPFVPVVQQQQQDKMVEVSIEQLPDEVLIKVIGRLSPWEAMALEATNKRMKELVRGHQNVQEHVDITYPIKWMTATALRSVTAVEKMVLSRFGHKLLKISCEENTPGEDKFFKNIDFMEQLAIKCPNLVELPAYEPAMLLTYARGRSSGLKKMTIRLSHDVTGAQVKGLLAATPQLEALKLIIAITEHHENRHLMMAEERLPLNELEDALLSTNCIRTFDVDVTFGSYYHDVTLFPSIQRLISKLPRLDTFNLKTQLQDKDIEPLRQLLQGIKCTKRLQFDEFYVPIHSAFRSYITGSTAINKLTKEGVYRIRNLTKLRELEIGFNGLSGLRPLVLPPNIRELKVGVKGESEAGYVLCLIRAQGSQLRKFYLKITSSSRELANQLLYRVSESCTALESLNLYVSSPDLINETNLKKFLTARKATMRALVFSWAITISPNFLEFIFNECKSLQKVTLHLKLSNCETNYEMSRLKELICGLSNLRQAEINVWKDDDQGKPSATCHYLNRKLCISDKRI